MSDHEKAWMARASKRARQQRRLEDHVDEIVERFGDHTNGCGCSDCKLVGQGGG